MVSGGFRVGGGVVGGGVVGGGVGGVVARAATRGVPFDGATARTTVGRVGGVVTGTVVGGVVVAAVERGARFFLTTVAARPCVCVVTAGAFDAGPTSLA
ncbi:MAG: hypothetical protein QOE62_2303 [Actinomycetota bacterium]|nr:hypothetical protein [Actinomycetota bacterium]